MSIKTIKINDIKIKPVITNDTQTKQNTLGYDMFPNLYSNIFLCSKKKSGKTTVISNILENCCDLDTKVIFFVSTIDKDATYKKIIKMLDKKKIHHMEYTDFIDEDKINLIKELVDALNKQGETMAIQEEAESKPQKYPCLKFEHEKTKEEIKIEKIEKKKEEKKKKAPEYVIVADDLGSQLRNKEITSLLKKNRHYKMKVILSSQYLYDLEPGAIKQLDNILIFRSFDPDKLEKIYQGLDLNIGFDQFLEMYEYATQKPFNFFYIGINGDYRMNFNTKLSIE